LSNWGNNPKFLALNFQTNVTSFKDFLKKILILYIFITLFFVISVGLKILIR